MSSREPSSAGPVGPAPPSDVSENAGTTKASIRGALAAHVQSLGWEEREFSDVTVTALGKVSRQDDFEAPNPLLNPAMSRPRETSNNAPKPQSQQEYPLHRLVLSRSPYFSVLMRGPWKDATSPTLTLEIQDPLVDEAAVEVALGFLYEKVPEELTPELATRTLAAASFLDLQALCELCADVIGSDIRTETLCEYVKLTTLSQYKTVHDDLVGPDHARNDKLVSPYGKHGDKIKDACWGYMCQNSSRILRPNSDSDYAAWWSIVPALNLGLVEHLFCSDELHVADEKDRSLMILRTGREILERIMRGEYHDDGGDDDHARKQCDRIERLIGLLKNPSSDEHVTRDDDVPHHVKYLCLKVLASVVYMGSKVRYEHVEDATDFDVTHIHINDDWKFSGEKVSTGFPLEERTLRWLEDIFPINADDLLKLLCLDLGIQTPKESFYNGFHAHKQNTRYFVERLMEKRKEIAKPLTVAAAGAETAARRLSEMGVSGSGNTLTELAPEGGFEWTEHELDIFDGLRPFRFSVAFPNILNLNDGQARHSIEKFYAGSLWKVSVQAFTDEDPKRRRTLGLFLHRRKGHDEQPPPPLPTVGPVEAASHSEFALDAALRQSLSPGFNNKGYYENGLFPVSVSYSDDRDTVAVRYELICPSRAETVRLGSLESTTRHTVLPRAPKGWGWRTALLFDDLGKMVDEDGALRIIAQVQILAEP